MIEELCLPLQFIPDMLVSREPWIHGNLCAELFPEIMSFKPFSEDSPMPVSRLANNPPRRKPCIGSPHQGPTQSIDSNTPRIQQPPQLSFPGKAGVLVLGGKHQQAMCRWPLAQDLQPSVCFMSSRWRLIIHVPVQQVLVECLLLPG